MSTTPKADPDLCYCQSLAKLEGYPSRVGEGYINLHWSPKESRIVPVLERAGSPVALRIVQT